MRLPIPAHGEDNTRDHLTLKRFVHDAASTFHQVTRTIVERDDTDSASHPKSTCKPGTDTCVTPAALQNTQNIAIILGVVIPLTVAVAVLIFLHRRMQTKQKLEDKNDPHKSLDFGMEGIPGTGANRRPEMSIQDISRHGGASKRGLSMDMDMPLGSPYLLPPGLQGSKESLHSLARSHDAHDPYRPVTLIHPSTDSTDSLSRYGRGPDDKGSLYSMSTGHHSALQDKAGLLAHARPMSQSFGKRGDSMSPTDPASPEGFPRRVPPPIRRPSPEQGLPEIDEKSTFVTPTIVTHAPTQPEPAVIAKDLPPTHPRSSSTANAPTLPSARGDSMLSTSMSNRPESSNYGDDDPPAPLAPNPSVTIHEPESYDIDPAMIYSSYADDEMVAPLPQNPSLVPKQAPGSRLSVMGMRPLPPDLPEDNPEVRANRIRSFYKEYFDDSKPNPVGGGPYQHEQDDIGLEGVVYDPETGGFFAPGATPWAQGPARRAMTPPPRARPRGSGNSSNPMHSRAPSVAYSTMSGGGPRGRPIGPKKVLPPPKPLSSLPTPHKLKEDDLVFSPIDFAPPSSFRELQNGRRPDSPLGTARPYSPSVRAFTPLASSFDALDVLPSPHHLRRSGTFTALDFAPPSKIRDPGNLSPSDAGSIRSNRSGISAMQQNAVKDGAYRVSRIPKEVVTTRDDLASQLKPKMNLTTPA